MAPSNKICVDANVLLEILLERKKQQAAETVLKKAATDKLYISALTAHLVVHFGSDYYQLPVLRQFLSDYIMQPLEPPDFEWAFNNARNNDFEDALQLAVAIHGGSDRFVTFDRELYKTYRDLPSINIELLK